MTLAPQAAASANADLDRGGESARAASTRARAGVRRSGVLPVARNPEARRRRGRRLGGARRHAQHHATRRQGPARHPVDEVAQWQAERREIEDLRDRFEIVAAPFARRPDDADRAARSQGHGDELTRRQAPIGGRVVAVGGVEGDRREDVDDDASLSIFRAASARISHAEAINTRGGASASGVDDLWTLVRAVTKGRVSRLAERTPEIGPPGLQGDGERRLLRDMRFSHRSLPSSKRLLLRLRLRRLGRLARRALDALGDARRFAAAVAQIIELGAPDLAAAHHLDRIDHRRIDGKYALDAFAVGDLADGEAFLQAAAAAGDADAFIGLNAGALAFGDLDVDDDRVAGGEIRDLADRRSVWRPVRPPASG